MTDSYGDRLDSVTKERVWRAHLAHHSFVIAELDYLRAMLQVAESDLPLERIASPLHLTTFEVEMVLVQAADVTPARPGFSGANPYEICQRFAVGLLSRSEVVAELSTWDYAPESEMRGLHAAPTRAAFDEVGLAFDHGLLDRTTFEEILKNLASQD